MENVTDEVSNPFGMRPPCSHPCAGGDRRAVFGYGDANADFHVIGDHPGVHGGSQTGIPFTDSERGEAILSILSAVDLLGFDDGTPRPENCFLSYLYLCCVPAGTEPAPAEYDAFELFFDAELRAITADVLLPVGERPTTHVIGEYTAEAGRIETDMEVLHGTEIHGQGFIVVPVRDPAAWDDGDRDQIIAALSSLRETDYRQMVDLGRFLPGGDPYFVR